MGNVSIHITEIEIADEDLFVRELQTEWYNKMDDPQKTELIDHCGVLQDIFSIIDGNILFCDPVWHVVGEPLLVDLLSGLRQCELVIQVF